MHTEHPGIRTEAPGIRAEAPGIPCAPPPATAAPSAKSSPHPLDTPLLPLAVVTTLLLRAVLMKGAEITPRRP